MGELNAPQNPLIGGGDTSSHSHPSSRDPFLLPLGDAENAGLENAGLENPGPNDRGGKRRTGKRGADKVWKA